MCCKQAFDDSRWQKEREKGFVLLWKRRVKVGPTFTPHS
jgi:hypothetical protein